MRGFGGAVFAAYERRGGEIPPLRGPTRSRGREREEKASARFGRNDSLGGVADGEELPEASYYAGLAEDDHGVWVGWREDGERLGRGW